MLRRSHVSYSLRSILEIYLVVATITLAIVVGISLIGEPPVEIIKGVPFATDIPGLDCSAKTNVSQWNGWFGPGFLGFNRLVPVADQCEPSVNPPSEVYSFGREDQDGSALPKSYYPVFSESDLMRQLCSVERIVYTNFYYRYTLIPYKR